MNTQTVSPEPTSAPPIHIDGRKFYYVVAQLCEETENARTRVEYFGNCFEVISEFFEVSIGVLNLRYGARTLERMYSDSESPRQSWLDAIDPLLLRAQTDETALATLYRNSEGTNSVYALAAPVLSAGGKPFGAVAFVINKPSFEDAEGKLVQLKQLLELIVENAPSDTPTAADGSKNESGALRSVVRASDYRSIHHLSFAIVNSLCSKFNCEQVAIGLIRNRNVRLMAVSGMSSIPKNTPGMVAIQQSMAACSDRNETTVVQQHGRVTEQVDSSLCKIHQYWHQLTGESSVATLPLRIDGDCVAVVAIRRPSSQPFLSDDLQRVRLLAESFAPALPLVDRASRSVARHTLEASAGFLSQLYSWKKIGPKLAAACVCALMAWIVFGKIEHRVMAPCKIVPEQVYTVSVPHEGMIVAVHVHPGDAVKTGDLLIQLDTKDLLIERKSLQSSITSTQIEANWLLHQRKSQEAFLCQAEIEVLKTDLSLIDEQILRSQIRAHQDGVVMPTEVHQRIGQFVALGEPLLEIANENKWHLEVEIRERDASYIARHQRGKFQSAARPEQQLECELTKISPSSQVLGNSNVVVAEAVLMERDRWMKLGMEGHVRIDTGPKPVWWVGLHPILDYVRLKLWL